LYQGYHRFAASRPIPHFRHVETANAGPTVFNTQQQKQLFRPLNPGRRGAFRSSNVSVFFSFPRRRDPIPFPNGGFPV
jgi:hypothetical protein